MERIRLTQKLAADNGDRKKRQTSSDLARNLEGFEYDPSKARVLKRALHNMNVALGALLSSMRELSLLRGSEITPDGLLGGRGFIMNFKEMKNMVNEAVTNLADITDTIADELTNPKWKMGKSEVNKVEKMKENIDEKVEEIEETAEDMASGEPSDSTEKPKEEPAVKTAPTDETAPDLEEPPMVGDSSAIESLKRYREVMSGKTADKTAALLSKRIVANLIK